MPSKFSSVSKALLLFLAASPSLATPILESDTAGTPTNVDIKPRATGDQAEPIEASFDVTGWPLSAEFNCYVMLCVLGGNRDFQRIEDPSERRTHYQQSGAKFTPFHTGELDKRNAERLDDSTDSGEEFPWESLAQGGTGAHLFPTTMAEQRAQGSSLGGRFRSTRQATPINRGDWIRITFRGYSRGGYCEALFKDPPDFSICDRNIKEHIGGHPEYRMDDYDQVMGSDYKLHLFRGSKKRSEEQSRVDVSAVKDRGIPEEGMTLVERDDVSEYEGSDMCVELPGGTNTCD
ncbi:hypothetical protein PFICI_05767 [Pestalotiopsis fici W106-1]|uniref:Deoxyribonuclease NucA/NucB domain-containing protein n=1 Tax=Pestalotiopsis fici (strain W106-1 / CGMCC3.15140) TaxID=1229662 RepID=W3XFA9_PESFW|nr:uncharacterized protein PFICI_05767 [Pestalotiopsis fici W106-1]ETS83891.1 hypothetical protein PFICI_05767 [Pestalotiopsis fici W106-1]